MSEKEEKLRAPRLFLWLKELTPGGAFRLGEKSATVAFNLEDSLLINFTFDPRIVTILALRRIDS